MANEIYASIDFRWDFKQKLPIIVAKHSFRADALAGTRYNRLVQNVGFAAWEAMELGDLIKQQVLVLNLDKTNFVSWGKTVADATELIRIPPLHFAFFYLIAATPALKADTAACDVEIKGVEGSG